MGYQTAPTETDPLLEAIGKFDIVGDVHGMATQLFELMALAGWRVDPHDPDGSAPIRARHPEGRHLVFTGDLINKGPDSINVLRLLMGMQEEGTASAILGNHEDMLLEAIYRPSDRVKKSVRRTLSELAQRPSALRLRVLAMLSELPFQLHLPMPGDLKLAGDGALTVVHAGARPDDIGSSSAAARRRMVHGAGLSQSRKSGWARAFDKGDRWVVHGHTPRKAPRISDRVIGLDTGAGEDGTLTMLRADTGGFLSVAAALTS